MKLIENIKNWWYDLKDQYHQLKHDKMMKKAFYQIIKEESNDRESFFNASNLRTTDFNDVVYVFNIPEEYQLSGQQWQIMDKLHENSFFVNRYLREELKLGDNVSLPEFYHIEDPSSNVPFSCKYMAMWKYTPVLINKKKIYTVNTILSIFIIGIITGIVFLFI